MCPNSESGEHNLNSYPETLPDGSVRPVVYCMSCGMEWR